MSDGALRDALRDLIPDYSGPVDPVPRVVATVRRRRVRQRTLLAVSGAGLAAVLALAVPALLLPGRTGGVQSAAPYQPSGGSAPSASGAAGSPAPAPPVYPVASGSLHGAHWSIGTTTQATGARLCAYSDDDLSWRELVCFDGWKAGGPVTWAAQALADRGVAVTRIAGVAPAGTASVRVRLTVGAPRTLPAKVTPTDRAARFFGVVLPGTVGVRDVTALNAAGTALGPPVTDPGYVCRPRPDVACVQPK